jgi:hypothetical protein
MGKIFFMENDENFLKPITPALHYSGIPAAN